MARGWESKSVEQQQEEASSNKAQARAPLTPEEIAKENHRRGLGLSRERVAQQLALATNPRHREMLEAALADLDKQLNGV
jgi:hypothetical protein